MRSFHIIVVMASWIACITCDVDVNVCNNAKDGIFLRDFSDPTCKSYFVCMSGQTFRSQCVESYVFNANSQTCDYESNVPCDICPSKPDVHVYNRAYPGLCDKYILCFGKDPIIKECAPGLQFDATSERCNEANVVDCVANKCNTDNDINNITYVPSASSCSKYFICYEGSPQPMDCGSKLNYEPETQQCVLPENYSCPGSKMVRSRIPFSKQPSRAAHNVECPKTQGVHFLPNPSDSSSYIVCHKDKAYYMTCSYGLVYDVESEECRKPFQH